MEKMNIPLDISILGINYTIELVETVNKLSPAYGEIHPIEQKILIDKNLPRDLIETTVFHELTHAIFAQFSYESLYEDEQLVNILAHAFRDITRQIVQSQK